jgi:heme A synthase
VKLRLRGLHPLIASLAAAWLLFYVTTTPPRARPLAWTVCGILAAQLAAGALNLVLLAPVWLQMTHLLLADLLWISLVLLCATRLAAEPA